MLKFSEYLVHIVVHTFQIFKKSNDFKFETNRFQNFKNMSPLKNVKSFTFSKYPHIYINI
jgi:hypothetical protein